MDGKTLIERIKDSNTFHFFCKAVNFWATYEAGCLMEKANNITEVGFVAASRILCWEELEKDE